MTRETKIGLLVGLAFIIVIGILLSDHINTTTDPIRADARGIYDKVEQSVDAPESRAKGSTDIVLPPQPVVPHNAVPTTPRSERHVDTGDSVINVGPGKEPSAADLPPRRSQNSVVAVAPADPDPNPDTVTDVKTNPSDNASVFTGQESTVNSLAAEAARKDEQIVSPNGSPVGISPAPVKPLVVVQSSGKQVKAEEGDNVSKLAGKYMGGNTRANREAIIKANPSMTPDGHLVFAGRTYIIPVPVATVAAPVAATPTPPAAKPAPVAVAPKPAAKPATPEAGNYYTVKENDNLWKIAASQLGAGNRCTEIKELNADILKGSDNVRVGMRLKIPNKSVASAN